MSTENEILIKTPKDLELPKLIWDEYRHRHDLCWNLLFKITLTTTILSTIPYLNSKIIPQAKQLVFFTPVIGIAVSLIGGYRLFRELRLLDRIRKLHRTFQNNIFKDMGIYKPHDLTEGSHFTSHVMIYLIFLTGLAILNFIILLCVVHCKPV